VWAGAVNPECKLLLMQHAFETLKFHRVEYKTDLRNARSRAAILKLGAKQEGILRKHMIMADGHVRDSVYFSIVDEEWPAVKAGLEKRLGA
jgi:RimJ/RimL family protein N-acetyltransferase